MFKRIDGGAALRLDFEGRTIEARAGDSVAAALLAAGVLATRRTAVSGAPRGPYCMMGVCFECVVEIDGVGGRQACLVPAADGMRVRRETGPRSVP